MCSRIPTTDGRTRCTAHPEALLVSMPILAMPSGGGVHSIGISRGTSVS